MRFKITIVLIFLAVCGFVTWYILSSGEHSALRALPYFGPKNAAGKDTNFHKVPHFNFTDQDGLPYNRDSVAGRVYVTEFFFTTCQTICPVMNQNLSRVYRKFRADPRFRILSHTVDPETDSASVLKAYAQERGISDRSWIFLTGNKKPLYQMARKGYLLSAENDVDEKDDFVHTQNMALVDGAGHIRGNYDGTDTSEITRMIGDIQVLLRTH